MDTFTMYFERNLGSSHIGSRTAYRSKKLAAIQRLHRHPETRATARPCSPVFRSD